VPSWVKIGVVRNGSHKQAIEDLLTEISSVEFITELI
jgi:hypothetical protein